MIQHLTDDQIARWILGNRSVSADEHVSQCGACALELNSFRGALGAFGTALRDQAEHRAAWQDLTARGMRRSAAAAGGLFTSGARLDAASPAGGFSRALSFALHAALVLLLMLPMAVFKTPVPVETLVVLFSPAHLSMPAQLREIGRKGGGGGGGDRSVTPPSQGVPPRGADRQIVPPMVEPKNLMPDVVVESTVVAPQLAQLAPVNFSTIGDPNGVAGPPSAGPGTGRGIGTGEGPGVGEGRGPGIGPGDGGGAGGGIFQVGGGVSAPRLLRQIEPAYSDIGRKARAQGTVELLIIVDETGRVEIVDVVKRLGYGLDEKAIDAVRTWMFEPGKKDGVPVAVYISVLVNFALR